MSADATPRAEDVDIISIKSEGKSVGIELLGSHATAMYSKIINMYMYTLQRNLKYLYTIAPLTVRSILYFPMEWLHTQRYLSCLYLPTYIHNAGRVTYRYDCSCRGITEYSILQHAQLVKEIDRIRLCLASLRIHVIQSHDFLPP